LEFKNEPASKPKPAVKIEPAEAKQTKPAPTTPSKVEPKAETPAEPKQKPRGNPMWYGAARPPPPNKGLKPLPTGEENCLAGKQFIVTGILDSLERDEVHDLIKSYGGYIIFICALLSISYSSDVQSCLQDRDEEAHTRRRWIRARRQENGRDHAGMPIYLLFAISSKQNLNLITEKITNIV
jgi:hypothetical protein